MFGLACNIDRGGRIYRIALGVLLLAIATVWFLLSNSANSTELYVLQGLIAAAGLFTFFEGLVGWCALRAMGIKTKI